jgi:hypothetical protein
VRLRRSGCPRRRRRGGEAHPEISDVAAPTRLDGWGDDGYLLLDYRRDLWAVMTDWYLRERRRDAADGDHQECVPYVKHNLICESSDLRPADLADRITEGLGRPAGHELDDKVRVTLAIRLISLLRTQLKSDLASTAQPTRAS